MIFLFETVGKGQLSIGITKYSITNYFNLASQTFKISEAGKQHASQATRFSSDVHQQ